MLSLSCMYLQFLGMAIKVGKKVRGFTLIELSVVMVIIALLVAGVLSGKELLNQAKIRTLIKQIAEVFTEYNTFLAKYNSPPGDLVNARILLGLENGNGDGLINTDVERRNVFLHMKKAKLLRTSTFVLSAEKNLVFQSKVSDVQIELLSVGPSFSKAYIDEKQDVSPIGVGYSRGAINVMRVGDLVSKIPMDVQDVLRIIDQNMDDGRYDDGIVRQDKCDGGIEYVPKTHGCKLYISLD